VRRWEWLAEEPERAAGEERRSPAEPAPKRLAQPGAAAPEAAEAEPPIRVTISRIEVFAAPSPAAKPRPAAPAPMSLGEYLDRSKGER
jgi:hypothetical protein